MSDPAAPRRLMRGLAVVLTLLWTATALAVAVAYRPGGPLDVLVVLICFGPVLTAAMGIAWPPVAEADRHRVALAWLWIGALLLSIPVLYGVASTLTAGGPSSLVPSFEAAYAGLLAVFTMALFSVLGLVHERRRAVPFERRATLLATVLAMALSVAIGAAFALVALINDDAWRSAQPPVSPYGPTDADLVPPFCDDPLELGRYARVTIRATSTLDDDERGSAVLTGRRAGIDETWSGSWSGPDGRGLAAYLRIGPRAWLNDASGDQAAPGRTWREVVPDPFGLEGPGALTMDGPPHAHVSVPRGTIVAEDLGLVVIDGARARHCRTFMDGTTALSTFLPLRWLLHDSHAPDDAIRRWRGEMDWWVFGDGQLGRATVAVSGSRADTGWDASGVQASLRAELDATDRDIPVDLSVDAIAPQLRDAVRTPAPGAGATSPAAPGASATPPASAGTGAGATSPAIPAFDGTPSASAGAGAALQSAAP